MNPSFGERHAATVAAAATAGTLVWLGVLATLLGRWPASGARWWWLAVVLVIAGAVRAALDRRVTREREARSAAAAAVATVACTAAASATVFAVVVLVLTGRPDRAATDDMRAALTAVVIACVVLATVARRIAARVRRTVYGRAGPRRELLDEFGARLGRVEQPDETMQRLVDALRPACLAEGAEIWLMQHGQLVLHLAAPVRQAEPIALDDTHAGAIGRAGVSGHRWAQSWLPEIVGPGHLRIAPLAVQGRLLGAVVIRRPTDADDFDDADDEGLGRVARLLAAALHSAELDAELRRTVVALETGNRELQRSRARLVTVADDERRRLERDLHDGAQSLLAAIAVKIQLARRLSTGDPAVTASLDEVERDLNTANAQLRTLAHGIFPPLLLTGGLVDALAGIAAHSPADVRVEHVVTTRFDTQTEAAVYFCCAEAVHNAAKHAGRGATVLLRVDTDGDGDLTFTVRDDGKGFDPSQPANGQGFTNMADRLGALGGSVCVESAAGRGTTVTGRVPAAAVGQRDSSVR